MYNVAFQLYNQDEIALFHNFIHHLELFRNPPVAETPAPEAKPAEQTAQLDLPFEAVAPVTDDKVIPITAAPSHPDNKPADMQTAIDAARAYITKKGVAEARKLLDQFKVNRVSDLQPAQIADFVRAATV